MNSRYCGWDPTTRLRWCFPGSGHEVENLSLGSALRRWTCPFLSYYSLIGLPTKQRSPDPKEKQFHLFLCFSRFQDLVGCDPDGIPEVVKTTLACSSVSGKDTYRPQRKKKTNKWQNIGRGDKCCADMYKVLRECQKSNGSTWKNVLDSLHPLRIYSAAFSPCSVYLEAEAGRCGLHRGFSCRLVCACVWSVGGVSRHLPCWATVCDWLHFLPAFDFQFFTTAKFSLNSSNGSHRSP